MENILILNNKRYRLIPMDDWQITCIKEGEHLYLGHNGQHLPMGHTIYEISYNGKRFKLGDSTKHGDITKFYLLNHDLGIVLDGYKIITVNEL